MSLTHIIKIFILFISIPRKYRPRLFKDVVGQPTISNLLSKAIARDMLPESSLFCGMHGVGKTTIARLFSKAISCLERKSGNFDPCGFCESCKRIDTNSHPDFLEIDAASNTGIADAKDLIESSFLSPVLSQYRIFALDEAHMLSSSAFNALLKAVEEPALHVKWIFITTEKRKIPKTLVSRCQTFFFSPVSKDNLTTHILDIANREDVNLTKEAAMFLADRSKGSIRDSLSLLGQLLIDFNKGDVISKADAMKSLGLDGLLLVEECLEYIIAGDVLKAHEIFNNILSKGANPMDCLQEILSLLTVKMRCSLSETNGMYAIGFSFLDRLWQMTFRVMNDIKQFSNTELALEVLIMRMSCISSLPSPAELIKILSKTDDEKVKMAEIDNIIKKNFFKR